jgi:hypothetical protein
MQPERSSTRSTRSRPATPPLRLRPSAPHTRSGLGMEMRSRTEATSPEPASAVAWSRTVLLDPPGRAAVPDLTWCGGSPWSGTHQLSNDPRSGLSRVS